MKSLKQKAAIRIVQLLILELVLMLVIAYLYVGEYGIEHLMYAVSIWMQGQRLDTATDFFPMFALLTGIILCIAILWTTVENKVKSRA